MYIREATCLKTGSLSFSHETAIYSLFYIDILIYNAPFGNSNFQVKCS